MTRRWLATGVVVLLTAVAGRASSRPEPRQLNWQQSGWDDVRVYNADPDLEAKYPGFFIEGSAGPIVDVRQSGQLFAGYGVRIGARERVPFTDLFDYRGGFQIGIQEAMFGEAWSLEAAFRAFDAGPGPSHYFVGLSLTSLNFIGERRTKSRLRGPSFLGMVIPEVGFWFPEGGAVAPYISYFAPFAYLLFEHVAVELRPSLTITFQSDPSPDEIHGWFSAAVMWR